MLSEESSNELYQWCIDSKIPNPIKPNDLHCSVITSNNILSGYVPDERALKIMPMSYSLTMLGIALVIKFQSHSLNEAYLRAKHAGAKFVYPTFCSHISLSYLVWEDFDFHSLSIPVFPIVLEREEKSPYMSGTMASYFPKAA